MALEERVARVEGVIEQMNERLGDLVQGQQVILAELRNKADKSEVRLLFGTAVALHAAVISLLGVILAKI